jgi:hypothetical protein
MMSSDSPEAPNVCPNLFKESLFFHFTSSSRVTTITAGERMNREPSWALFLKGAALPARLVEEKKGRRKK